MMRAVILAGGALALVFTVCGCGDNIDSVTREEIKLMDQKADALEKVKDRESAEKARSELEKLNEEKTDLEERMKKLTKDKKPEKVLEITLKHEEAETKTKSRLRQARAKALKAKDAAAVLKGIDLD
jgi:pyruvate/2-oxoacid:ferredoxin oxidoreductase beta subunit